MSHPQSGGFASAQLVINAHCSTSVGIRAVVRLLPVPPVLQRPRNVPREQSSLNVVVPTAALFSRLTVARMLALRFAALGDQATPGSDQ